MIGKENRTNLPVFGVGSGGLDVERGENGALEKALVGHPCLDLKGAKETDAPTAHAMTGKSSWREHWPCLRERA